MARVLDNVIYQHFCWYSCCYHNNDADDDHHDCHDDGVIALIFITISIMISLQEEGISIQLSCLMTYKDVSRQLAEALLTPKAALHSADEILDLHHLHHRHDCYFYYRRRASA